MADVAAPPWCGSADVAHLAHCSESTCSYVGGFVFTIFSFFMIFYTSRVYENLISQKLLPTDAAEVNLLCASVFNSQVMVSMGNHPAVHVAWILAALSACWTTTNPHLQVDIKIVLLVGFSMHAFTHHSQMRLRERRLEWEASSDAFESERPGPCFVSSLQRLANTKKLLSSTRRFFSCSLI